MQSIGRNKTIEESLRRTSAIIEEDQCKQWNSWGRLAQSLRNSSAIGKREERENE